MQPSRSHRVAAPIGRSMSWRLLVLAVLAIFGARATLAHTFDEPAACRAVRLADPGWTAESATTAVVSEILRRLGYAPTVTQLTAPVTFEALRNGDIDVFLGHWRPAQASVLRPFVDDGSVQIVGVNLARARYTLAVPGYLYDAGLDDFADLDAFREPLGGVIYGLEPGNDGNAHLLEMIRKDDFGLAGFKLVESSEQGMLAQVERSVRARQPVVLLAWEPHPMNTQYDLRYLEGGDDYFGPDFGAATVSTIVRKDYLEQCPNVGRFLQNLGFTVELESAFMERILTNKVAAADLAREWVGRVPPELAAWLEGVRALDGGRAIDVFREPGPSGPVEADTHLLPGHMGLDGRSSPAILVPVLIVLVVAVAWGVRRSRGRYGRAAAKKSEK
jgi:glycine betaine/proline transport system substrate-binding protein